MINKLKEVQGEFPGWVGDVRGKGLMIGVEMVNGKGHVDKAAGRECSIEPIPSQLMANIWEQSKDMGLLLGKGGVHGNVSAVNET